MQDSDPDPTKNQRPTSSEGCTEDASDDAQLTDEQLENAAGGYASTIAGTPEY